MTDPRNHKLGIYPKTKTPEIGEPLMALAVEQANDHKRAIAERVAAKSRTLPPVDDRRTEIVLEFREELRTNKSWRDDLVGESVIGREKRIVDAFMLGDLAELGDILNEGLTAGFLAVIDSRLKAEL